VNDRFRFQGLLIWQKAVVVGNRLYDIADDLESRKLFRFADQTRGAALSLSNNIAEGSGSTSDREFAQFLNIARRSVFENANMAIVFAQRGLITEAQRDELLALLEEEAQMITGFAKSLHARRVAKLVGLVSLASGACAMLCQALH
jgi:four helix bundle protein